MQEFEIKEYIQRELSKGQLINVLADNIAENTDMLIFIITKHNGESMNISKVRQLARVREYIQEVQIYG